MSSPLFDTLFRPTTLDPLGARSEAAAASAAPVRVRGTRTRAGNAMDRTRAALLAGAARAVEISGTRITMAQVAAAAGVAKATLYNHFRTRETVLGALLVAQVRALVDEQAGKLLGEALSAAAVAISQHPLRRALAVAEPAAIATIATIDRDAQGWQVAREAVETALAGAALDTAGGGGADVVLRWLASFLLSPADSRSIAVDVDVLLAGLAARAG